MPGYALYHTDGYRREINATVTCVDANRIALDRTIFYAQGGGQVADHGTLVWTGGTAQIVDVRKDDAQICHQIAGDVPAIGTPVHGTLDWERRYALMRTHTATHILNGVIWRDYRALVTGASVDVGRGRIDFELDRMSGDLVAEVEAHLNAEVAADRAVRVRFLPRAELLATPGLLRSKWVAPPEDLDHVRVIEIVDLDTQACGGTHVARTGEVGRIRVVGHESKGRMNKRIRVALDEWAAASEGKKGG
jgi:misacylated tRNA(Ala) deacylase